jgi:hypothetical protein
VHPATITAAPLSHTADVILTITAASTTDPHIALHGWVAELHDLTPPWPAPRHVPDLPDQFLGTTDTGRVVQIRLHLPVDAPATAHPPHRSHLRLACRIHRARVTVAITAGA